jgi:lipocalin
VQWTFEAGGRCVTADYGTTARADVVSVLNTVRVLGLPIKVSGYAVASPATAGALDVTLGPGADPKSAGSFSNENYRVFALGPVIDGVYDYALVSDPRALSLYVLARNTTRFATRYDAAVLAQLDRLGFTSFLSRPRKTSQTDCRYTPPPSAGTA